MCTQWKLDVLRKNNNNNLFNPGFSVLSETTRTLPILDAFILNIFIGMLSLMNNNYSSNYSSDRSSKKPRKYQHLDKLLNQSQAVWIYWAGLQTVFQKHLGISFSRIVI